MKVSDNIKVAVAAGNISDVRDCLWSATLLEKVSSGNIQQNLDYVFAHGVSTNDLFEEDDGEEFDTMATEANYSHLGGLLSGNFSKRKLDALQQMARTLWPPKPTPIRESTPEPPRQRPRPSDHDNGRNGKGKGRKHIPEKTILGDIVRAPGNFFGWLIDLLGEKIAGK